MLFRTVFGPELAAVYGFILAAKDAVSRPDAHRAFMPDYADSRSVSTQSIDDAFSFLVSADLIREVDGDYVARPIQTLSFRLAVLMRARSLQLGDIEPKHVTDPLYMLILEELFVRPNRVFVADLHTEANKLRQVQEVGGLSKEKLQAWKRVMAYLGMGWRVGDGFVCACVPSLLMEILDTWEYDEGPLQVFLEAYLGKFLPFQTVGGDLADSIGQSLLHSARNGGLVLVARYDSPAKPYFGEQRLRHLTRIGGAQ